MTAHRVRARWRASLAAVQTAVAFVLLGCAGDGGSAPPTTPVTPAPTPGSISVTAAVSALSVVQGQSGTVSLTVARVGSFTGAVDLTVEGAPSGVTAAIAPVSVGAGATSATLSLQLSAAAAAGTTTLTVRARGTGVSDATAAIALTVTVPPPTPTIALAATPAAISVVQGATGAVTLALTRGGGFAAAVDLTAEGLPNGVTAVFAPAQLGAGVTASTVTLQAAAAAATGNATVTIRARGTGVADATAPVTLTVTAPPLGGFAIAVTPPTASVQQGQSVTTTVTVTRTGGFTGAVALSATTSSGVTASFAPSSVTGSSSTLTLSAAAGATVGAGALTITGTATGAANATATAAATITVTAAPPVTGSIAWTYCGTDRPLFFAVQDGNGAWTRVTPGTDNVFRFDITASRGGVAAVQAVGAGHTMNVYYLTRDEIVTYGTSFCDDAGGRTVTGTVAGVGSTDLVSVALGGKFTSVVPSQSLAWSLANVRSGSRDLVAARAPLTLSGFSVSYALSQMILRRNVAVGTGGAQPVLDFGGTEAFAPSSANVTLVNGGGELSTLVTLFSTANGASALLAPDVSSSAATTRAWRGVPTPRLVAGDLHQIVASATPSASSSLTGRQVTLYSSSVVDRTLTFGPALASVSTATAGGGMVRLRSQYTLQSQYNRFFVAQYQQTSYSRIHQVSTSSGYLQGASAYDVTVPDLSALTGWQSAYGLAGGVPLTWTFAATGWTGGTTLTNFGDGNVVLSATTGGQITP